MTQEALPDDKKAGGEETGHDNHGRTKELRDAFSKEMFQFGGKGYRTRHFREIALDGKIHNNKMERMNGEILDRE